MKVVLLLAVFVMLSVQTLAKTPLDKDPKCVYNILPQCLNQAEKKKISTEFCFSSTQILCSKGSLSSYGGKQQDCVQIAYNKCAHGNWIDWECDKVTYDNCMNSRL